MRGLRYRRHAVAVAVVFATFAVVMPSAAPGSARALETGMSRAASLRSGAVWPRQYFDLRNDSFNRLEHVISTSNVHRLQQTWEAPVDGTVAPWAGPLITSKSVYIGTLNAVHAFDRSDGSQRWEFFLGDRVVTTGLAIWNNLLFVTEIDLHRVFALDRETGQEVWSLATEVGPTGPTVVGDVLLFDDSRTLRAVRAATGDPVWTATLPDSESYAAVSGTTAYLGTLEGDVVAIDVTTGGTIWTYHTRGGAIEGSLALSHGVAYFGTTCSCGGNVGGFVFAFDTVSRQKLWRQAVSGQVVATPAVANGMVYVSSFDGTLYTFDARTGKRMWTAQLGLSSSAPTVANGIVYAVGNDGVAKALDAKTGREMWSYAGTVPQHVAVADGAIYFGDGRTMRAFALKP